MNFRPVYCVSGCNLRDLDIWGEAGAEGSRGTGCSLSQTEKIKGLPTDFGISLLLLFPIPEPTGSPCSVCLWGCTSSNPESCLPPQSATPSSGVCGVNLAETMTVWSLPFLRWMEEVKRGEGPSPMILPHTDSQDLKFHWPAFV